MDYIIDDKLSAPAFLALANNVWPGDYDEARTQEALNRTLNITAYDGGLLALAKEHTPTMLYLGAQPGVEGFYEKNGCKRDLQSYVIEKQ